MESGDALADVARWLCLGPADRRAPLAVKALVYGGGLRLAECAELIDGVIAEVDPEYFQQILALRVEFTKAMDDWADELRPMSRPDRPEPVPRHERAVAEA